MGPDYVTAAMGAVLSAPQVRQGKEMMRWQWHQLDHIQITAPHSRQITMPAPHHSILYRPDVLPDAQPTMSKH